MIRQNRQRKHLPALLRALAFDHFPTSRRHWSHQHQLAAAWAPDEVINDEMDAMFISVALVCLIHGRSS